MDRVVNQLSGTAHVTVQAGTISGGVHVGSVKAEATARPAHQWGPFDLDVHRAVDGDAGAPPLPAYLRREHDDELDRLLADPDASAMVVITGESSTGKTRAMYEAVRGHARLRDWSLVYPRTSRSLTELAQAPDLAETVVWLNEAQQQLSGPGGDLAAAALRDLLARPGPVVVLGTLWPRYWSAFTATPTGRDEHPHTRALLTHCAHRVRVAERFTSAQIALVHADPRVDRRIVAATRAAADRRVIQTVTGGPALVERHDHPDTQADRIAAAIVTAAVDARRLGHHSPIPESLLADAAVGYLHDDDRVDPPVDWFATGLDRAARHAEHGVTALISRRLAPDPGPADAYDIHDYLYQRGLQARQDTAPPATLWEAVSTHARQLDDCARLTQKALQRLVVSHGITMYRRVAPHLDLSTKLSLLALLIDVGAGSLAELELAEVPVPLSRGVIAGQLTSSIDHHVRTGPVTRSSRLIRLVLPMRVVPEDMVVRWSTFLDQLGARDEAIEALRLGLTTCAARTLRTQVLMKPTAEPLVGARVDEELASLLAREGRWDEALDIVQASGWQPWVEAWLVRTLAERGRLDRLRELADAGGDRAAQHLASADFLAGDDEAYFRLLELGRKGLPPVLEVTTLLIARGEVQKAMDLVNWDWQPDPHRLTLTLSRQLAEQGHQDDAIALLRAQADKNGACLSELADHLHAAGRSAEALRLAQEGGGWVLPWLASMLARAGNLARLRQLAATSDYASHSAALALLDVDRADDALAILLAAPRSEQWMINPFISMALAALGRISELAERVRAGDIHAVSHLLAIARERDLLPPEEPPSPDLAAHIQRAVRRECR